MPCRYDPYPDDSYSALKEELDKLTRLLCYVCGKIESFLQFEEDIDIDNVFHDNRELKDWWKNYKLLDENRKQELKDQALAKLTPEEREALGFL